jgi:hypothetical protein
MSRWMATDHRAPVHVVEHVLRRVLDLAERGLLQHRDLGIRSRELERDSAQ